MSLVLWWLEFALDIGWGFLLSVAVTALSRQCLLPSFEVEIPRSASKRWCEVGKAGAFPLGKKALCSPLYRLSTGSCNSLCCCLSPGVCFHKVYCCWHHSQTYLHCKAQIISSDFSSASGKCEFPKPDVAGTMPLQWAHWQGSSYGGPMPHPSCLDNGALMTDPCFILCTSPVVAWTTFQAFWSVSMQPNQVLFLDLSAEARVSALTHCKGGSQGMGTIPLSQLPPRNTGHIQKRFYSFLPTSLFGDLSCSFGSMRSFASIHLVFCEICCTWRRIFF